MKGHPSDRWLDGVFHAKSRSELTELYDGWAESYDTDMQSVGYVHPAVVAGLAGRYFQDTSAPILDAGVGTGTVGNVLSILGYRHLIGVDMSEGMLAKARARGIYADLKKQVLGDRLDFADASIAGVVSTGVFTEGHAPASAFDELVRIAKHGAHFIFTITTVVWTDSGFADKLSELCDAQLLEAVEETGLYHPMPQSPMEAALTARAYVYRRL